MMVRLVGRSVKKRVVLPRFAAVPDQSPEPSAAPNGKARPNNGITATTKPRRNARSLEEHARLITAKVQELEDAREHYVGRIFELGRAFQAARDELGYGGYGTLFADNGRRVRGFNQDRAERLRAIAANPVLANSANWRKLPTAERTLFELTRLPEQVLRAALDNDRIHPEMTGKDVEVIKRKLKNETHLRYRLISVLETVQRAVAVNPLIPLLTHYWFTGTHVMGYNGQITLQVPFRTDLRGAVPGKVLELLQRASFDDADDIKIATPGGNISITDAACARLRITLPMLEPNFIFNMPMRKRMRSDPEAIAELIEAIEYCLISVGRDTLNVEHLGITLEPEHSQIILYSTDGATIARASISDRLRLAQRTILPTAFCEQMKHLYRERLDDK